MSVKQQIAWIKTIHEEEAGPELREGYARYRDRVGYLSKYIQAFSLKPKVLRMLDDFQSEIIFGTSSIGRRREELISVVVSSANNCAYCGSSHAQWLADEIGEKDTDCLLAVCSLDARDPGYVGDLEKWGGLAKDDLAMLSFARRLTRAPETMENTHVAALRAAGFSDEQILDIVIQVAYKNFTTRFCLGLGVELEERHLRYRDAFQPRTQGGSGSDDAVSSVAAGRRTGS